MSQRTICTSAGCRRSTRSTGRWSPNCKRSWISQSISATATGNPTSKTPSRPCATTVFAAQRYSQHPRGADTPAAHSIPKISTAPGGRPGLRRPNSSNCADTSTTHYSSRCSPTTSQLPRRRCPTTRDWCSPRTPSQWPPTAVSALICIAAKCVMPQGLSRPPLVTPTTTWPGSHDRALRKCRGWSRMSPITSRHWPRLGTKAVIVCPIGFVSDHIEVVWDLDTELRAQADAAGIAFARASTPNADRRFARLAVDLIDELRYDRAPARVSGPDPVPGCAASINGEACRPPHCVAEQRADRSAG